jgi:hypothetical protein
MVSVRLNPYNQATVETNRYSVPVNSARQEEQQSVESKTETG